MLAATVGEPRAIAESVEELAQAEAAAGHARRAAVLIGAAQAFREAVGSPIPASDLARFEAAVRAVTDALGEQRFSRLLAAGYALTLAAVLDLARTEADEPQ